MPAYSTVILIVVAPVAVGLAALWVWYQWKYQDVLRVARSLPVMTPTLPLLGHSLHIVFSLETLSTTLLNFLSTSVAKSKGTFVIWIGPVPLITITRVEDIKTVLNSSKTLERGHEYDLFKIGGGNGLITCSVAYWKITRRHLNAMTHPRNLEHLMPVFNKTHAQLVRDLSKHVGRGPFDILNAAYSLSLANVLSLLFGPELEVDNKSNKFKHLLAALERAGPIFAHRVFRIWLWPNFMFRLLYREDVRNAENMWRDLPDEVFQVLDKRVGQENVMEVMPEDDYEQNKPYKKDDNTIPVTLPDVYDYIRKHFSLITEKDMQDECKTFLSVGTDTEALTVIQCLVVLGSHPEIQEKLYNEIVNEVGKEPKDLTIEDIKRLKYMDQVLKETMRRFQTVPFILRKTVGDLKLSDCTVPKDATIVVSIIGIHMDPRLHPDPQKFDPERFSPENIPKMDRYSYLPFGGGPRNCIGKQYAKVFMKMMLTYILREYKVSSKMNINEMKFLYALVMYSKDGYIIELEKRN